MQKIVEFMAKVKVKNYNFKLFMCDEESPEVESFVFNIKTKLKSRFCFILLHRLWLKKRRFLMTEVKKVNLDIRKFLKNQALVGSLRILLLHFIAIKLFGGRINKMNKLVFSEISFLGY